MSIWKYEEKKFTFSSHNQRVRVFFKIDVFSGQMVILKTGSRLKMYNFKG